MSFALFISNFQLVSVRGGIHDFGDYSTLNIILYPKTISCTNVLLQGEGRALAGAQLGTGQLFRLIATIVRLRDRKVAPEATDQSRPPTFSQLTVAS
jgi:hypothetical protein